jgi:nitrite reductase/ring-hydroxylating ferredoxin subunit
LFAYDDACPHHGTPMAWRRHAYLNGARDRIVCAAHGAQFEIDTGRCTLGPCLGEHLRPVTLTVHRNGEVHIAEPLI